MEDLAKKTLEELIEIIKSQKAEITQSVEVVKDLKSKVEEKKDIECPVSVDFKGKKYRFTLTDFTLPIGVLGDKAVSITAKEAAKNAKILEFLVKNNASVLVEVIAKKEEA